MAGSARYTAILDANTLYLTLLRDLLLSLAKAGLFHARWTSTIHDEWTRNLAKDRPDVAAKLPAIVALMNQTIPDCLVENYEPLMGCFSLPDADDRHVVAAAVAGHADAIVTYNLRDFPLEVVAPLGIEGLHPDEFVMNQLQLHDFTAIEAVKQMRARWSNPSRTANELIDALERRGLPLTAAHLRLAEGLI